MEKSYIPKGMKIKGDVISDGDLLLAGEVDGNVQIEGILELEGVIRGHDLKVGRIELAEGVIESNIECLDHIGIGSGVTIIGDIKAKAADVDGAVLGNLDIEGDVRVGSTAVIEGKVLTKNISIDLGAVCDIDLKDSYSDSRAADFFEEYLNSKQSGQE